MAQHAALGASGASRWMNCPASLRVSRGLPNKSSVHAEYGTAAHALAEWALTGADRAAEQREGDTVEGVEVDADMVFIVDSYVAEVLRRAEGSVWSKVEHRFTLDSLNPPAPMFGTADFVCISRDGVLSVVDLKAGAGVRVQAKGNMQLRYYALGAWLALPPEWQGRVRTVDMVIVQPRNGGVSTDSMEAMDLLGVGHDLIEAAKRTLAPDAPAKAGDWCRWCPAKGECVEQHRLAVTTAQGVFNDGGNLVDSRPLCDPLLLTEAEMAAALERLPLVQAWCQAVAGAAMGRISTGQAVPGWKLVTGKAHRKWANEDTAAEVLAALGVKPEDLHTLKLLSPAQAEKRIPKDRRKALVPLIVAGDGGPTLAREDDPRPALGTNPFADQPLF